MSSPTPADPTTAELLAKYAELMNRYGPDSLAAHGLLWEHCDNAEFIELAEVSYKLKKALESRHG